MLSDAVDKCYHNLLHFGRSLNELAGEVEGNIGGTCGNARFAHDVASMTILRVL
jgi:hypothetical protein